MGSASGGIGGAIILYEAALGLGIASGPLLGGFLGGISWRGPFFGTAALMAIAFIAIFVLLEELPKPARKVGLTEPLRALRHRGLLITALVALFYNFGFFTLLAYTPFPLKMGAHALGLVFFGWGLLLAISSVFAAPPLKRRFGVVRTLGAMYVALAAILADHGLRRGRAGAAGGRGDRRRRGARRRQHRADGGGHADRAGRAPDRLLGLLVRALRRRRGRAVAGGQAGRVGRAGRAVLRRRRRGLRRAGRADRRPRAPSPKARRGRGRGYAPVLGAPVLVAVDGSARGVDGDRRGGQARRPSAARRSRSLHVHRDRGASSEDAVDRESRADGGGRARAAGSSSCARRACPPAARSCTRSATARTPRRPCSTASTRSAPQVVVVGRAGPGLRARHRAGRGRRAGLAFEAEWRRRVRLALGDAGEIEDRRQ